MLFPRESCLLPESSSWLVAAQEPRSFSAAASSCGRFLAIVQPDRAAVAVFSAADAFQKPLAILEPTKHAAARGPLANVVACAWNVDGTAMACFTDAGQLFILSYAL